MIRVALAVLLIVGATGCTLLGEVLGQKTTTAQENHDLQRMTALKFRRQMPSTESIRFTREGNVSGAGSWAANAVVTIAGVEYQEIMGPAELGGDRLPDPESIPPAGSMTIFYSDGTSEDVK